MDQSKILHAHLRDAVAAGPGTVTPPFVTISREAGAGGHILAYVLATDFLKQHGDPLFDNWQVCDKERCAILAADPDLKDILESILQERCTTEFKKFIETLVAGRDTQYAAYKKIFQLVHGMAAVGKVIIVGRAGACVARELPCGIHIRLVAPEAQRVQWIRRRFRLTESEARAGIRRQDRARRKLVKVFFDRDVDDPLLYDAVWNTASARMHEIAAAIITLIRMRAGPPALLTRAAPTQQEIKEFFHFDRSL